MQLHGSGGAGDSPSLVGGQVVGRRVVSAVEVKESVANGVAERVVSRTASLMPDRTLVEAHWPGNIGRRSSSSRDEEVATEQGAKEEEEGEGKGREECGDDGEQQVQCFHLCRRRSTPVPLV